MPINIPKVQTTDRNINQLQQNVSTALKPMTSNIQTQGIILQGVPLKSGSNTINTGLNRNLSGWQIIRKRADADIHDDQDNNPNQKQTLILVSSADVSVDLYVF